MIMCQHSDSIQRSRGNFHTDIEIVVVVVPLTF